MSIADSDDEDLMRIENFQLGQAHLLQCLKNTDFRRHGETREQFGEQPKAKNTWEKFQYYHKDILRKPASSSKGCLDE